MNEYVSVTRGLMNKYVIKGLKSSQDLGLVILPLDRNVPSPFFCLFFCPMFISKMKEGNIKVSYTLVTLSKQQQQKLMLGTAPWGIWWENSTCFLRRCIDESGPKGPLQHEGMHLRYEQPGASNV